MSNHSWAAPRESSAVRFPASAGYASSSDIFCLPANLEDTNIVNGNEDAKPWHRVLTYPAAEKADVQANIIVYLFRGRHVSSSF